MTQPRDEAISPWTPDKKVARKCNPSTLTVESDQLQEQDLFGMSHHDAILSQRYGEKNMQISTIYDLGNSFINP